MLPFLQVVGHPGDKEVVCPLHTEISTNQRPKHGLPESNPPRKARVMRNESPVTFDKFLFRQTDLLHFSGVIPEPSITDHYPAQTQCGVDKKGRAPAERYRYGNNDQRGK